MITPEDNNKDNAYERVKRWREKNRALYNLRQREYRRKKNLPVPVLAESTNSVKSGVITAVPTNHCPQSEARESTPTIEALRELVRVEQEKPSTEARTKPDVVGGVYHNDSGGVISKFTWEKLQKMKEKAKEGGYTLDEYSQ